jgi:hypothetical protein
VTLRHLSTSFVGLIRLREHLPCGDAMSRETDVRGIQATFAWQLTHDLKSSAARLLLDAGKTP